MYRESEVALKRKGPGRKEQERVLSEQDGRCLYCLKRLGSLGKRKDKRIALKLNWDHQIPIAYAYDNSGKNFCAACHVCNSLKSSMIFNSLDEARVYLLEARKEKGYDW